MGLDQQGHGVGEIHRSTIEAVRTGRLVAALKHGRCGYVKQWSAWFGAASAEIVSGISRPSTVDCPKVK